jgi:hypothetical protein
MMIPTGYLLSQNSPIGVFENHADIGSVKRTGSVQYDTSQTQYTIAGGGENMWLSKDAFHFAWKKMNGDVSIVSDIRWIGTGGNAHRNAY